MYVDARFDPDKKSNLLQPRRRGIQDVGRLDGGIREIIQAYCATVAVFFTNPALSRLRERCLTIAERAGHREGHRKTLGLA